MGALIAQRIDGASGTDQGHGEAAEVKVDWAAVANLVQTAGRRPLPAARPARSPRACQLVPGGQQSRQTGASCEDRQQQIAGLRGVPGKDGPARRRGQPRLVLVTYRSVPCFAASPAYVPVIYTNNL